MGKKSKPPPPPDYAALAKQQADLNKTAATEQTVANRPNQTTPWGNTAWSKAPDGSWSQNVTLNPQDQALLDQNREFQGRQQGFASGLLGQAGDSLSKPMSLEGLPGLKDYDQSKLGSYGSLNAEGLPELQDMDLSGLNKLDPGFSAVEGIRDAMMSRMAPQRQQARDAEIQRLKSQGIPENSEAMQRAMTRLDQGDTDAQQQALLGAAGEYGNIFNRGLAGNAQTLQQQMAQAGLRESQRGQRFGERSSVADFANRARGQQFGEQGQQAQLAGMLRQQSMAEQDKLRQAPMNDFLRLTQGINPTMPQMPSFMSGTGYNAADMYGAGKDQYGAQMNNYNAQQARSGGLMSGLFGLAGSALGGPAGSLGSKLPGIFGFGP